MKRVFELINRNLSFSRLKQIIRRDGSNNPPLITISREYGSGGSVIAHQVAKKMGKPWKVYHQEIVDEIVKESHLEKELIKRVDESKMPLIEEVIDDFFGRRYLNLSRYYKHLVKILSTIGHRGHAIILGRGANFLFPEALKIRVLGDMDSRIKILIKYQGLSEKQAIRKIDDSDRRRKEFTRAVFDHDPKKAHHYDLIIRTSENLSIDQAVETIVHLANLRFG